MPKIDPAKIRQEHAAKKTEPTQLFGTQINMMISSKCPICGENWHPTPDDLDTGKPCTNCRGD